MQESIAMNSNLNPSAYPEAMIHRKIRNSRTKIHKNANY